MRAEYWPPRILLHNVIGSDGSGTDDGDDDDDGDNNFVLLST